MKKKIVIFGIIVAFLIIAPLVVYSNTELRYEAAKTTGLKKDPLSLNPHLQIDEVSIGLPLPKYMAVVGDDVLFTEQYTSNLYLIKNDDFIKNPILEFEDTETKFRILGLTSKASTVFVHYAELLNDSDDPFGEHYFFKYDWTGNDLINPQPFVPHRVYTDTHHVGPMFIDKNDEIFITSDVYKLTSPENEYVVMGIHGYIQDPISGNIWSTSEEDFYETETYDRLHLSTIDPINEIMTWELSFYPDSLAIPVPNSQKYQNSLFIGDCKGPSGTIYELELNSERTNFVNTSYDDDLIDFSDHIFADGFKCVSDLEFHSDGSLYVVSNAMNGAIYKISMK